MIAMLVMVAVLALQVMMLDGSIVANLFGFRTMIMKQ